MTHQEKTEKKKTFLVLITKEMSKEILYIFQKIKTVVWRKLDNSFSSFLEGKKKKKKQEFDSFKDPLRSLPNLDFYSSSVSLLAFICRSASFLPNAFSSFSALFGVVIYFKTVFLAHFTGSAGNKLAGYFMCHLLKKVFLQTQNPS